MGLYDDEEDKKLNQDEQNQGEPVFGPDDEEDLPANENNDAEKTTSPNEEDTQANDESSTDEDSADSSNKEDNDKHSDVEENKSDSSESKETEKTASIPNSDFQKNFDEPIASLQAALDNFNESLRRFEAISEKVSADLPQIIDMSSKLQEHMKEIKEAVKEEQQIRSEICQCAHWLENTNKHYTEFMTAMPKIIYNIYAGEAQKYEVKFKKTFKMLDDMIKAEMAAVKQPGINYGIIIGIAVVQMFIIVYLIR